MTARKFVRKAVKHTALNIFFIVCCFLALLPILYALSVSLDAKGSLLSSNFSFIPKEATLDHYIAVFTKEPVIQWFGNTMLLTAATVVLAMCCAVPAAYVFSRQRFPGRKTVLRSLLLLHSFPSILSMFAIYSSFNLLNV